MYAIVHFFHDWFKRQDVGCCSLVNVRLDEHTSGHPGREATIIHLANILDLLRGLTEAAGVLDVDDFTRKWHILMKGSIVAAGEGDKLAARRAQEIGRLLLTAVALADHQKSSGMPST